MAGRIETKDLISPEIKKELADIEKALSDLNKQISVTVKQSIELKKEFDNGAKSQAEASDRINKVNKDLDILAKSEQEVSNIEKQYQNVLAKTKAERTDQAKQLEKLKQLRTNQNKSIKEEIKLEKSQADSIDRLTAANKKLLAERNKLNTSTQAGRMRIAQINSQMDKNTETIRKNSSAQEKQRMNIGNYKDALSGLPGPIGNVTSQISNMGKAFLKLLMNPIVALIMLIVGALVALYKAFKSSDSGATELAARFEQLKAIIDVFRQRLIDLISVFSIMFDKTLTWKERLKAVGDTFDGIKKHLKDATDAAYMYQYALDSLEDDEISYMSKKVQIEKDIAKLEHDAQNRTLSTDARRKALKQAIALGEEELKKNKEFAERNLNIELDYYAAKNQISKDSIISLIEADDEQTKALLANNKELASFRNKINNEGHKKLEELYSKSIELDKIFFEEQKRNISKLSGFEEELRKEEEKRLQIIEKLREETTKYYEESIKDHDVYVSKLLEGYDKEYEGLDELLQNVNDKRKEQQDKELEELKRVEEEKKRIKIDIANQGFELLSALSAREISTLEQKKEYELQLAGENAGERERIEKRYDAERRKILKRQAIADKAQATFNTIINTKEAISKASPNPYLIAFAAILGAAQLATIIATPIPQFKKGTKHSPEGLAIVGEVGRELIEYPSGYKALTPDTATMTYLPRGSRVHTKEETNNILNGLTNEKIDELINETRLNRKNKNIIHQTMITDSGMKKIVKDANSSTTYIDTYFRK